MSVVLTLTALGGAPGNGKTRQMATEAVEEPGRYAFFYPTIELLDEQAAHFEAAGIPIFKVHSRTNGGAATQAQLEKALARITAEGLTHVAILMCHRALLDCVFAGMEDWHWRIDEAPVLHTSGRIKVANRDVKSWRSDFDLEGYGGEWRHVVARDRRGLRELRDSLYSESAEFVTAAQQGRAFIKADAWKAGTFDWLSIWSPATLPSPKSVVIGSAGFDRSIGGLLLKELFADQVRIGHREVAAARTGQPAVTIRYFAEWEASSKHWASRDGRRDLKAVASVVRAECPGLGYWSGNEEAQRLLDHYISDRECVPPKVAGLNKHADATSCAMIYSAKATSADRALMTVGLTSEAIRIAREDEDIFQFVFRGQIRRPAYGGAYECWLFSRQQAERLQSALVNSGLVKVQIERIESGVSKTAPEPPKLGRKPRAVVYEAGDAGECDGSD